MWTRHVLFWAIVLGALGSLASLVRPTPTSRDRAEISKTRAQQKSNPVVNQVDQAFESLWAKEGVEPAQEAADLAMFRRLSLALRGSTPSLEEIRAFEAKPRNERVNWQLEKLLADRRFADYLAQRFARVFVGVEDGPFIVFRRSRLVAWLSDQFLQNRPYDAIVRDVISSKGLWTDQPATNFISVTYDGDRKELSPDRLAARVARAFLGVRIDCAQCHDHPFQNWKQADFQGLAAFFGNVEVRFTGVQEGKSEYQPVNRKTGKTETIAPRVPFLPELLPAGDLSRRDRLAGWLTDPRNPYLAKATVNRVWWILAGKPLVAPVDDLGSSASNTIVDLLADDFSKSGFDLKRLIRNIVQTRAYRLDSATYTSDEETAERTWAAFPLSLLRPEQVVRSLVQASSVHTIDGDSHILVRLFSLISENDFVGRFGDANDDAAATCSTIPQRLLLMNGKIATERTRPELLNASSLIAQMSPNDEAAVRNAYLALLTREPTAEESAHFQSRIRGLRGDPRKEATSDIFWTLVNSTEFSWMH